MTTELTLAIALAITQSTRVVLAQRGVPDEDGRLSSELGNNCAQHVVLLLEMFLADGELPQGQGN